MKLLNSLKTLLNEAVSNNEVKDSIRKKKVVNIYYDGGL